MKPTLEIHSISTFKRDSAKIVRKLKKTRQRLVLTINGKPELVVQGFESFEKLLEAQDRIEAIDGIKRGLKSMKQKAGKPAERFFSEFFVEEDISEHERGETILPAKRRSMSRRISSHSRETQDVLRALRRSAKRALELGIATGTPVYVMRNNKIVDLTKDQPAVKKSRSRLTSRKTK